MKAGLTLHAIAYLCARHDDAGEVNSRLEVLVSMAREIAAVAVENGRWDHVVASRALADQLSPLPISSFTKKSPSKMVKSTSMFVMDNIGLDGENEDDLFEGTQFSIPPSANSSSGSDSSEEVIEEENETGDEECGFWAASIIDDVKKSVNVRASYQRRQRANSICSSNSNESASGSASLSSSPKGFWLKRPDSPDEDAPPKTVSWSPSTSPASNYLLHHVNAIKNPSFNEVVSPKQAPPSKFESCNATDRCITPMGNSIVAKMSLSKTGMTRCQSFSAFSSSSSSLSSNVLERLKLSTEDEGRKGSQYQDYFNKFVDLLVERETLTAGRKKSFCD